MPSHSGGGKSSPGSLYICPYLIHHINLPGHIPLKQCYSEKINVWGLDVHAVEVAGGGDGGSSPFNSINITTNTLMLQHTNLRKPEGRIRFQTSCRKDILIPAQPGSVIGKRGIRVRGWGVGLILISSRSPWLGLMPASPADRLVVRLLPYLCPPPPSTRYC